MKERFARRHAVGACAVGMLVALCSAGCSRNDGAGEERGPALSAERPGRVLAIGDIDPDTPARRAQRLQPLADFLAFRLGDQGFSRGAVVIARDMDEMSGLVRDGRVDLYIDSVLPTLVVREHSGSRILLRRRVQGSAEYRTLFITAKDSGIASLDELRGSFLALQEEYSTSGYLLPAGTLLAQGYELTRVSGPTDRPVSGAIGYFFSRDEENTVELVRTGGVAAGAVSSQDFEQMPEALRNDLRIIGETRSAPRQLVSVRSDLEPEVVERIIAELLALAGPGDEPVVLEDSHLAWSWRFDPVTPEISSRIEDLRDLADLVGVL